MSNKQILLFIISSAYCRFDQTSYGAGVSKKLKKKKKFINNQRQSSFDF